MLEQPSADGGTCLRADLQHAGRFQKVFAVRLRDFNGERSPCDDLGIKNLNGVDAFDCLVVLVPPRDVRAVLKYHNEPPAVRAEAIFQAAASLEVLIFFTEDRGFIVIKMDAVRATRALHGTLTSIGLLPNRVIPDQ